MAKYRTKNLAIWSHCRDEKFGWPEWDAQKIETLFNSRFCCISHAYSHSLYFSLSHTLSLPSILCLSNILLPSLSHTVSLSLSLLCASCTVWPDWAIFECSWWKIFNQKWPKLLATFALFWKTSLLRKNCCGFCLGNFWNHLGYFLLQHLVTLNSCISSKVRPKLTFLLFPLRP